MDVHVEKNKTIQPGDEKAIAGQPDEALAIWWCQLNRFDWPDGLPDPIVGRKSSRRRGQIMKKIMNTIGHKACLREWNKDSMTPEEFEEWYPGPR